MENIGLNSSNELGNRDAEDRIKLH